VNYPSDTQHRPHKTVLPVIAAVCTGLLVACGPSRSAERSDARGTNTKIASETKDTGAKRYPLTGRVVSIDKADQSINIDGNAIPGFMAAMTMPYQVKDASVLEKASPGDEIKGEIVVGSDGAYLENIELGQTASSPKPAK
jgi:protein SCO1